MVLGNMAPAKSVQEIDRSNGSRGVQGGKRRTNLATLIPERLLLGIFDASRWQVFLNLEVRKIRACQVSCVTLEWAVGIRVFVVRRPWPPLRSHSDRKER